MASMPLLHCSLYVFIMLKFKITGTNVYDINLFQNKHQKSKVMSSKSIHQRSSSNYMKKTDEISVPTNKSAPSSKPNESQIEVSDARPEEEIEDCDVDSIPDSLDPQQTKKENKIVEKQAKNSKKQKKGAVENEPEEIHNDEDNQIKSPSIELEERTESNLSPPVENDKEKRFGRVGGMMEESKTKESKKSENADSNGTTKADNQKKTYVDTNDSFKELCEIDKDKKVERQPQKYSQEIDDLYTFDEPDPKLSTRNLGNKQNSKIIEKNEKKMVTETKAEMKDKKNESKAKRRTKNGNDQNADRQPARSRRLRNQKQPKSYVEVDSSDEAENSADKSKEKVEHSPSVVSLCSDGDDEDACLLRRSDLTDEVDGRKENVGNQTKESKRKSQVSFDLPSSQSETEPSAPTFETRNEEENADDLDEQDTIESDKLSVPANTKISGVKADKTKKSGRRDVKDVPIAQVGPMKPSPIISHASSTDSLVIEDDDSYNARRYKLEMSSLGYIKPKSSGKRSKKESYSKKKTNIPQVKSKDKKNNVEGVSDVEMIDENNTESTEEKVVESTVKQAILQSSQNKAQNMIFQVSYTKSTTRSKAKPKSNKAKSASRSVKKETDPFDFDTQCDNASMQSERNKRKDMSKELNKKIKAKQLQHLSEIEDMSNNMVDITEDIPEENDVQRHEFSMYQDKKTKKWLRKKQENKLDTSKTKLDTSKTRLDTSKMKLDTSKTKLDTSKTRLDTSKMKLDTSKMKLDTSKTKLDTSKTRLDTSKMKLDTSKTKNKGRVSCMFK